MHRLHGLLRPDPVGDTQRERRELTPPRHEVLSLVHAGATARRPRRTRAPPASASRCTGCEPRIRPISSTGGVSMRSDFSSCRPDSRAMMNISRNRMPTQTMNTTQPSKSCRKPSRLLDAELVDQNADDADAQAVHQHGDRDRRQEHDGALPDRGLVEHRAQEAEAHQREEITQAAAGFGHGELDTCRGR